MECRAGEQGAEEFPGMLNARRVMNGFQFLEREQQEKFIRNSNAQ